ncbi:MAG: ribosome-recycling factor [Candidatus Makana argininalis]
MINKINDNINKKMNKCIDSFKIKLNEIRTSRASPDFLKKIKVKCYGNTYNLDKLSNINTESYNSLSINVFDIKLLKLIKKSILSANLGLNPILLNNKIKVHIPKINENRRKELIKLVKNYSEINKISIRNIRRYYKVKIKTLLKEKKICKDDNDKLQKEIQKKTDFYIKKIKILFLNKKNLLLKFI